MPAQIAFPELGRLAGYRLEGEPTAGSELALTLVWDAEAPGPETTSVFVHLMADGAFVGALSDGLPRAGAYPASDWRAGERIVEQRAFRLPEVLPPGSYTLRVGLYDTTTGARWPALEGGMRAPDDSALLTRLDVR